MRIDKIAHRSLHLLKRAVKAATKKIRQDTISYYSALELGAKFRHFRVRSFAVLIDGTTDLSTIHLLDPTVISGYYSFDLNVIDSTVNGQEVRPLLPDTENGSDAWLVSCTNELAAFSLCQYLMEKGLEHQYIFHHVKHPNGTKYYSYVDFFSNGQRSLVQINNYYQRCYHIPFPLDLKLTLRNCSGDVVDTRQIIIPPDALRTVSSDDFLYQNFEGYLEVEFEIAKKVMPFLHYMVDYISADFISSNHQSGLGLHPPNTEFNRGYIPISDNESLVVCLFQRNYITPVTVTAKLRYLTTKGEAKALEKDLPPISQNQMRYQDIKHLFDQVDFSETLSPYVVISSKVPLHRPNYYYTQKGKLGYYDVSHATRDPLKVLQDEGTPKLGVLSDTELNRLNKYHCVGMDLRLFLFPESYEIDTWLALGNDTTAPTRRFKISVYDEKGDLHASVDTNFEYDCSRYVNISQLLREANLSRISGTAAIRPCDEEKSIPLLLNGVAAYRHRKSGYLSSTAANGSQPDNIPFYFRGGPPSYILEMTPTGVTEIFARGISSAELDTFYAITFPCGDLNQKKKIRYEICLVKADGEKRSIYRTINAHGTDFLVLSQLIADTGHTSESGHYTVWFCAFGAHLYGKHFLYRNADSALAVEHCYVGKYGL